MTDRGALLTEYVGMASRIGGALADLTDAALNRRETSDVWSIRQIVHHLADVEVGDAMRLRQMAAHDAPLIVAYDEDQFARRLHYERPIASSLATFLTLRESNHTILACLEESDWLRIGRHEEHDLYTVEILALQSIEHDRLHLDQIRRALETMNGHPA